MAIQLEIPALDAQSRLFVTWVPIRVRVRQVAPPQPTQDIDLTFRNGGAGGQFWFSPTRAEGGNNEITLTIPADGTAAEFWMAGEFQQPSTVYGDATIAVFFGGNFLGEIPGMVRVRKDAQTLTDDERNRYLSALGTLNAQGTGRFNDLRAMHTNEAVGEAHGRSGFGPWHRAFVLDLERELQAIDPSVTLPYWRFDEPAPNLFTEDFIGLNTTDANGVAQFSPANPLSSWVTDGVPGIRRFMRFNPMNAPAVISEAQTLGLGGPGNDYAEFAPEFEVDPHGRAHVSFSGLIQSIHTAARDPLFFMLHANVDRLWAKWQWIHRRHNRNIAQTYRDGGRVGHGIDDSMWPWNGVTSPPRPTSAPGGALQSSPVTLLPGDSPVVAQMIDYMNVTGAQDLDSGGDLGFCYDDVPFEFEVATS